jgi:RNA polymerase sigma factor (sigma-70 family)
MPTPPLPIARLRRHLAALDGPPPTDAELLVRFITARDDDAFAELVRRHGPTVLAVCRRITRNREDADDAFQATFLALARKAARLRPGVAVGGWLFGAAVRAARTALARSCRRRDREVTFGAVTDIPDRPALAHDPEAVRAVLEEVAGLSAAYRAAVVLCELEGRSRATVARDLGIPEGTLSSRLAAARRVLARRLRDRGLAPAVLAAVAGGVSCPVLAADAARLAGSSVPHSTRVVKLSEEAMGTLVSSKWWAVPATILLAIGLTALAAGRPEDPKPPVAQPVPADSPPGGRLLLMRDDGLTLLSPDGKKLLGAKLGPKEAVGWARLSPDGKRLAYLIFFGDSERQPRVMVRDLDGGKFATSVDLNAMYLLWAPDGKSLVATSYVTEIWAPLKVEHARVDLTARTVSKLPWPDDVVPVHWSADGKTVVVVREGEARSKGHLGLMTADGKRVTELADITAADWHGHGYRLSADGAKVLFSDVPPEGKDDFRGMTSRLYVLDVATRKKTEVPGVPLNATVFWSCWSPDGKKIAYTWRQRHEDVVKRLAGRQVADPDDVAVQTEAFLIVADADGSNAKTIASGKADSALDMPLGAIDWR